MQGNKKELQTVYRQDNYGMEEIIEQLRIQKGNKNKNSNIPYQNHKKALC